MILTVNVSNSSITLCAWEQDVLRFSASLQANRSRSADEYAVHFCSVLSLHHTSPEEIHGVIISCVVPSLLATVRRALTLLYSGRIYIVGPGLKTGIPIRMNDPAEIGSEIVCAAVAAKHEFGAPCLMICMDTAISITVLNESGALAGGAVAPGLRLGVEALASRTAHLTEIDLEAPVSDVVGTTSYACVQSGVIFGTAAMLDGMIGRFEESVGLTLACVATGDLAPSVLCHCRREIIYRRELVHRGLLLLWHKNSKTVSASAR